MDRRDPRCVERHVPNCGCEGDARGPIVNLIPTAPAPAMPTPPMPVPAPSWPKEVPLRFLKEVGTIAYVYAYWKTDGGCGGMESLYHSAEREFARTDKPRDEELGGPDEQIPTDNLPTVCKRCGAVRPEHEIDRRLFRKPLREAPDGMVVLEPAPGDCYYVEHKYTVCEWDNCDDDHLTIVCPDGAWWDTCSRANNCTMKNDRTHRCWVIHGDPRKGERPTSDKNGHTCAAGAGSIQTARYHGFLVNGVLRT